MRRLLPFLFLIGCGARSALLPGDSGAGGSTGAGVGGDGSGGGLPGNGLILLQNDRAGTELQVSFTSASTPIGCTGIPNFGPASAGARCVYEHCEYPSEPAQKYPLPTIGEVTITGKTSDATISDSPDGSGIYLDPPASPQSLYQEGESLGFHAAGSSSIPADGVTLSAAGEISVTSPAFSGSQHLFDTTEDLTITWNDGLVGDTALLCMQVSDPANSAEVTDRVCCRADAGTGQMVLPAKDMSKLPKSTGISSFSMVTQRVQNSDTGGWTIDWVSAARAYTQNGDRVAGILLLK